MAFESASVTSPSSITGTWPKGFSARKAGRLCSPCAQVDVDQLVRQAEQRQEQLDAMGMARQRHSVQLDRSRGMGGSVMGVLS